MRSTSSSDARPRSLTFGQRAMNFSKYGATDLTLVCCSMISDSHTWYGSAATPGNGRHGNLRRCRSYHASSSAGREADGCGLGRWLAADEIIGELDSKFRASCLGLPRDAIGFLSRES